MLQVSCHTFSFPAPLQSLQHLLLTLGGGEADVDLSTLALAPNLVTVRIETLRRARKVRITLEHLDFRPLSKLKAVSLECIVPSHLSLPQHCWLAVLVDELEMARSGVWDSVRSHIRSFGVSCPERLTAMTDLPAMLLREPPIVHVALKLMSFGAAESPLQLSKALARATALMLESKEGMYLKVPDEALWQHLIITAPQQQQWEWLSASRDVAPWVPQKVPFESLSILFGSLLGPSVLELFREFPRQSTRHHFRRGRETHICMSQPGTHHVYWHQWDCCCGACEDCLWKYWRESVWPYSRAESL